VSSLSTVKNLQTEESASSSALSHAIYNIAVPLDLFGCESGLVLRGKNIAYKQSIHEDIGSRDSSVGTAKGYGAGRPGFDTMKGKIVLFS
jgi:hypothetical protein